MLSLAVLVAAVAAVDVTRLSTGITALGFLNLLFVWLAIQQLGFWLADGRFELLSVRVRLTITTGSILALLLLTVPGPYPVDMLQNLNPPTLGLLLIGTAQLMVFTLIRKRLRAFAERPRIGRIVDALGSGTMTVYLWHMPVIILLAAGLLILNSLIGVPLPEPLSFGWWATRPLWILAVGAAVFPGAVLVLLVTGMTLAATILATVMLVAALALSGAEVKPGTSPAIRRSSLA